MAVHLITGDDESLLLTAVSEVVHRLIGDGDRSLMVDEFDDEEYEVRSSRRRRPDSAISHRVACCRGPRDRSIRCRGSGPAGGLSR